MISAADNAEVFLLIPEASDQRVLHLGTLISEERNICTARLEEGGLPLLPGQGIFVYYEFGGQFMQQTARVKAVMQTGRRPVVGFEVLDKPVSAESRGCTRVSTIMTDLVAQIEGEANCPVLDVSGTGICAISTSPRRFGDILQVELHHQGHTYRGRATIKTVRVLSRGRTCYGLYCMDEREGLKKISEAVQQQFTRHFADAG